MLRLTEKYVKENAPDVALLITGARGSVKAFVRQDGTKVNLSGSLARAFNKLLPDARRITRKEYEHREFIFTNNIGRREEREKKREV